MVSCHEATHYGRPEKMGRRAPLTLGRGQNLNHGRPEDGRHAPRALAQGKEEEEKEMTHSPSLGVVVV